MFDHPWKSRPLLLGETIQVIDRFHKRYDNGDSDFHIIILTYFLPLSLSPCSNGTSVSLQIERTSALWRKLLRNLELRIWPKLWPQLPFSWARIISDENIWMFSPFSVSLSIHIWVRVENSLLKQLNWKRISCNSNRLQKGCESNWGTSWPEPLK